MSGVISNRHRQALTTMRAQLRSYRRRGVPGAAELDQPARDLLLTTA
jgi:hypothetical protein